MTGSRLYRDCAVLVDTLTFVDGGVRPGTGGATAWERLSDCVLCVEAVARLSYVVASCSCLQLDAQLPSVHRPQPRAACWSTGPAVRSRRSCSVSRPPGAGRDGGAARCRRSAATASGCSPAPAWPATRSCIPRHAATANADSRAAHGVRNCAAHDMYCIWDQCDLYCGLSHCWLI